MEVGPSSRWFRPALYALGGLLVALVVIIVLVWTRSPEPVTLQDEERTVVLPVPALPAVADMPLARARELWQRAAEAGLELEPVSGLVPLGRDRDSGLWEFAHLASGEPPEWEGEVASGSVVPSDGMALVLILLPGGRFWMGAQKEGERNADPEAFDEEGPVHEVDIGPFLISKYELTQAQWHRLAGGHPSRFSDAEDWSRRPVERVSWVDCQRLEPVSGLRLPSEAEWEYATRAGLETRFSFRGGQPELSQYAWYEENSDGRTHAVGLKRPNAFGLHDVHGNVWEWCQDTWHPSHAGALEDGSAREEQDAEGRVVRGGSWYDLATASRSAFRGWLPPDAGNDRLGLRPAMSLP